MFFKLMFSMKLIFNKTFHSSTEMKTASNLFLLGFITILGQVIILRELSVTYYGVELIYILAIGIWLLGTSLGAMFKSRLVIPSIPLIQYMFLFLAIILIPDIIFIRSIRILFGGVSGAYLPFFYQILALLLSILPISFIMGLLFQWIAGLAIKKRKSLAWAYGVESLGGIAGGLISTILMMIGIQNSIAAALYSLSIIITFYVFNRRLNYILKFLILIIFAANILYLLSIKTLDQWTTAWNHPYLIEMTDSPYGRITISGHLGQFAIFENDELVFETEGTAAEEFIHLSLIQHPDPSKILLLGGGMGGTINELLKYPVENIDYVELNETMVKIVQPYIPQVEKEALNSSKVNIIFDDPRNFLQKNNFYDVIIIGMPQPTSGQTSRFYTMEFFNECAGRLAPGGIISFKLSSSENIWTRQLIDRTSSIYFALKQAFSNVLILPGSANIFTASNHQLSSDIDTLTNRFISRNISARLVSPDYIQYLYKNDRFEIIKKTLENESGIINSDFHPVSYQHTTLIWLSKFFPSFSNIDIRSIRFLHKNPPLAIGLSILLICFIIAVRLKITLRRIVMVFIAGFSGILLETVLFLHYQIQNGVLYQNLGILLMIFMGGLAAGAIFVDSINKKSNISLWLIIGLLSGFSILNIILLFLAESLFFSSISGTMTGLFLTGFYVSGIFSFTGFYKIKHQESIISPLYAADLLGGCIGSIIAILIIIPGFGLKGSIYITLLITCLGFLFI